MIAAKHAKRIALDTYTLSSLFLRQVLLTKPITLASYREKTRELLLNQSRLPSQSTSAAGDGPNLTAIKLLEWDREWNLLNYYGFQEYVRRWWRSRKAIQTDNKGVSKVNESTIETQNKAQVAFMITSEQRQVLSNQLGYSAQDIRSFKPIEALLLVKHSVKKESGVPSYDFRTKLNELIVENDQLMRAEQAKLQKKVSKNEDMNQYERNHDAQTKPDVALALLNAEKGEEVRFSEYDINPVKTENEQIGPRETDHLTDTLMPDSAGVFSTAPSTSLSIDPDIKPWESEQLHMKPDVAAAVLSSQQQHDMEQETVTNFDKDDDSDEPCWYEVIEVVPLKSTMKSTKERVIALFSNKKEAVECVRIKESFRGREKESEDAKGKFLVRRRWNV